jgi:hypothetical protein
VDETTTVRQANAEPGQGRGFTSRGSVRFSLATSSFTEKIRPRAGSSRLPQSQTQLLSLQSTPRSVRFASEICLRTGRPVYGKADRKPNRFHRRRLPGSLLKRRIVKLDDPRTQMSPRGIHGRGRRLYRTAAQRQKAVMRGFYE